MKDALIDRLRPYPAYKDSGVPWLGKVPAHWEVRRGKWLFQKMDRPVRDADQNVTCFRDGLVTLRKNRRARGFTESLKEIGYQGIRRGDLVIHAMDAFAGAIGVSDSDGKGSPVYSVCRPKPGANALFFAHVLREMARCQWITALAKGIRERSTDFRYSNFAVEPVPLPPLPEQLGIVQLLDWADRRIRRVIRAQQKRIKLLEEYKQALIHRAVTGQIDVRTGQPYPAYKPSGVEWLGEVPAHWEVVALRLRYHQCLGKMLDSKRITGAHLLPYLRNADVQWDRINASDLPAMDIRPDEYERYTVRPGDLLVCEGGEVGRCAIWRGRPHVCGFQKALHRLRPRSTDRDEPRFLFFAMRLATARDAFDDGHESTIGHLTGEKLRAHRFGFPPKSEQGAVVAFLDEQTAKCAAAVAADHRQIDLLKELRARLIADVVTGKLDVREVAASLPEEPEADEVDLSDDEEAFEAEDDAADDDEEEEELAAASAAEA